MATNQSALDSLVARASDEEMSVEEYLRHLLALESALFESVIAEKRESKSRPNAGLVVFEHRAINQRDEVVCTCKRTALMQKKSS